MEQEIMFILPYLINNQMQLLIAILGADKYFRKAEFGFWVFEISRSCQKPGDNRQHDCVNIPVIGLKVKRDSLSKTGYYVDNTVKQS